MKVSVFGGTGFVGKYIIDELLKKEYEPHILVRPGNIFRLESEKCTLYIGDIENNVVISNMLQKTEAVIYNIGLIRENISKGMSFEKLHFEGVRRTVRLSEKLGIKKYILMSANGVQSNGTPYQKSKYLGEQFLKNSQLNWTIIRPSLIFGNPRGKMEFCLQIKKSMISKPIPAPLFYNGLIPMDAGRFTFTPVHVTNIAQMFVKALTARSIKGKILEIGGEKEILWKQLLTIISTASGKKKLLIPVPVFPVKVIAGIFGRFQWFPVTIDQLNMLLKGNICSAKALKDFGIEPIPFNETNLKYLNE